MSGVSNAMIMIPGTLRDRLQGRYVPSIDLEEYRPCTRRTGRLLSRP